LQIWDLKFYTTSDQEDNDTDEEIKKHRNQEVDSMKNKEILSLKESFNNIIKFEEGSSETQKVIKEISIKEIRVS
jgi:hypothetical protein